MQINGGCLADSYTKRVEETQRLRGMHVCDGSRCAYPFGEGPGG